MPTIRVKGAHPAHIILEIQEAPARFFHEHDAEKLFLTLKANLPSTTFRRLVTKMERYKYLTREFEQRPWEQSAD